MQGLVSPHHARRSGLLGSASDPISDGGSKLQGLGSNTRQPGGHGRSAAPYARLSECVLELFEVLRGGASVNDAHAQTASAASARRAVAAIPAGSAIAAAANACAAEAWVLPALTGSSVAAITGSAGRDVGLVESDIRVNHQQADAAAPALTRRAACAAAAAATAAPATTCGAAATAATALRGGARLARLARARRPIEPCESAGKSRAGTG